MLAGRLLTIWRARGGSRYKRRRGTINIPRYRMEKHTMPFEFAGIISGLYERVPNIDKAIICVHTRRFRDGSTCG